MAEPLPGPLLRGGLALFSSVGLTVRPSDSQDTAIGLVVAAILVNDRLTGVFWGPIFSAEVCEADRAPAWPWYPGGCCA